MAKMLIIEDNEHMHRIYADKFRREGYQVIDAFDGEQGLAMASREIPLVILLDLMMPKLDGYGVLQKLREDPATASIPVLVISNKSQPADVERALSLGAKNFFFKGMTLLDDLATETRKLCRLKKALVVSSRPVVVEAIRKHLNELDLLSSANSIVVDTVPRAERERPDIIFLDMQLAGPGLSLLLQRLGASAKAKSTPVILVGDVPLSTAAISSERVVAQIDVPIDPARLAEAVRRCTPSESQPSAA